MQEVNLSNIARDPAILVSIVLVTNKIHRYWALDSYCYEFQHAGFFMVTRFINQRIYTRNLSNHVVLDE